MDIKRWMLTGVVAVVMAANAMSAENATGTERRWTDRFRYDTESGPMYRPNELSLDLFGTYTTRDRFGSSEEEWGGGAGLNYFLTRYVGIGADSHIDDWIWPRHVNGSLILRFPVAETGLAPYAFGGGGRQYKDLTQWTAHAGGGVEFRINPHAGIFADGRRVFPDETRDFALWRAGFRFSF